MHEGMFLFLTSRVFSVPAGTNIHSRDVKLISIINIEQDPETRSNVD